GGQPTARRRSARRRFEGDHGQGHQPHDGDSGHRQCTEASTVLGWLGRSRVLLRLVGSRLEGPGEGGQLLFEVVAHRSTPSSRRNRSNPRSVCFCTVGTLTPNTSATSAKVHP